mgnify:CR=1 FL=1
MLDRIFIFYFTKENLPCNSTFFTLCCVSFFTFCCVMTVTMCCDDVLWFSAVCLTCGWLPATQRAVVDSGLRLFLLKLAVLTITNWAVGIAIEPQKPRWICSLKPCQSNGKECSSMARYSCSIREPPIRRCLRLFKPMCQRENCSRQSEWQRIC